MSSRDNYILFFNWPYSEQTTFMIFVQTRWLGVINASIVTMIWPFIHLPTAKNFMTLGEYFTTVALPLPNHIDIDT